MNILVFTNNTWDDTNSIGNTMSNIFCGDVWKNDTFFNLYNRSAIPQNTICNNYYKIPLTSIIKNNFKKEKIGEKFFLNKINTQENCKSNKEQKFIDFMHKYSLNFIYPIANHFYRKKKWINKNFKQYIQFSNPDIFFAFLIEVALLKPIIEYVKNNTNAKIVLFSLS